MPDSEQRFKLFQEISFVKKYWHYLMFCSKAFHGSYLINGESNYHKWNKNRVLFFQRVMVTGIDVNGRKLVI